jgi:sporulation protein YlmC with PRC-barrel domain
MGGKPTFKIQQKGTFMMKKSLTLALCAATSLLVQSGLAEDHSARVEVKAKHHQSQTLRVSKFLGTTVRDQSGQTIGQLKDIVMQPTSGQAEFAIIELNEKNKLTAVPWRLLQPSSDATKLTLNADREKVLSATTFDNDSWPTFESTYNQRIYAHYGMTYPSGVGGRVSLGEGEYRAPVVTREGEKFPRPQPDGRETFPHLNEREKTGGDE